MDARVKALGHPVHPMLVVFPVALFVTGTLFDLFELITGNGTFAEVGFWPISVGLIGGVLAAVAGFADWTKIPAGTRAKRIGRVHGLLNAAVLVLFVIAWAVRLDNTHHAASGGTFAVQVIGVVLLGASAWLGGELVDRLGIGVHDDAHPDAPSSLAAEGRVERSATRGRIAS